MKINGNIDLAEQSETLATLMRREHVKVGYRSLRLNVQNLSWQREGTDYIIKMRLPSGAYASGVIKQVW